MTDQPLISVVTVVYNDVKNLENTMNSVFSQTYKNVDYIVIDGGSTDGTVDIIKKHASKLKYWTSGPDKGIYDAMNKAIAAASREGWMNFMNSGDKFASPDVLDKIGYALSQQAGVDILYGNAEIQYEGFGVPFKIQPLHTLWKYSPFCHQAAFIKASLMKEYQYDLQYKIGADHDLFFRTYKNNGIFSYINVLVCLFDGREGTTKKRIVQAIQDKKNIALKYEPGAGKWLYYQFYLAYIKFVIAAKRLLGTKLTATITRLLKKK
ncbi:MAG TPA: glycosyltransferase family 2 protein [Ohtaekwangia sp.]